MTATEYATRKLEECFSEEELRREKDRMDEHYVSSCMFAAEDLAEAFEAGRKESQPKWIPCSERMPKEVTRTGDWRSDEVLTFAQLIGDLGTKMSENIYYAKKDKWLFYDGCVTHWMPLPKSPKEGGKQ